MLLPLRAARDAPSALIRSTAPSLPPSLPLITVTVTPSYPDPYMYSPFIIGDSARGARLRRLPPSPSPSPPLPLLE